MTIDPPAPTAQSAAAAAMRLVSGFQVSRAIYAGAAFGMFDRLVTPRSSDEVAAEAGTHGPTTYRLLRALASVGLLDEQPDRVFALTPAGNYLRSDVPGSLVPWALSIGRDYYWEAWGGLPEAVRTGECAFTQVHGQASWDWRATHPEDGAAFNRAMTSMSQRMASAVVMAHDFNRYRDVVDVGGGTGTLIAAILRRYRLPRGIVFDLPEAVDGAQAVLARSGFADRATAVGGSFFEKVPEGADAYVLQSVLHNWDDEHSIAILRTIRAAMRPEARLLVLESEVGPPNTGADVKFLDLNMLVIHGSRERTREELAALLAGAGLTYVEATRTAGPLTILEARPV
ncbi:MAG TPA: methyltransferase [Kofleriaceae bacterium]|nr:methyltransferase [Kofleriaceae bacterium]